MALRPPFFFAFFLKEADMEREFKGYWTKTIVSTDGSLKVLEIYLDSEGLYRVVHNRNMPALVFGSWEAIEKKFPIKKSEFHDLCLVR